MKVVNAVVKVLVALAAVAGAVYVVATYGEEIVAWAKKVLNSMPKCRKCCQAGGAEEASAEEPEAVEDAVEESVEEPAAEEPVAEEPAEEPVAEESAEGAVVADESDFEG